jgi:hypothetical protein
MKKIIILSLLFTIPMLSGCGKIDYTKNIAEATTICIEYGATPKEITHPHDNIPTIECTFPNGTICLGDALRNNTCLVRPQVTLPK